MSPEPGRGPSRRRYLDWLRGVAVLIMIEAHTLDSWTRVADRGRDGLPVGDRARGLRRPDLPVSRRRGAGARGRVAPATEGSARRRSRQPASARGLWIFGLAFLFRLQSWLISGGAFPRSLLKVDILNIMGVAMMVAAVLWDLGRRDAGRAALFAAATIAVALMTPLIRATPLLTPLPDPIEGYLRPRQEPARSRCFRGPAS